MLSSRWIETRRPHWERLQGLLQQCGNGGTHNLSRAELRDLTLLYRQVAADLSTARSDASSAHYARYLNQLLGRAHSIIYSGKRTSPLSIFYFFAREWPVTFWRLKTYIIVSTALFCACALAGSLLTLGDQDFALQVLGPGMIESIERGQMWTHSIVGIEPVASSTITTNNISVAFTTFAMGITAGIGTLYMIAFNGLLIGVVGAACGTHGMSLALWSFVVGHGSLEIPAILIAGAAGLRIGTGIMFPDNYSRRDAMRIAGREAIKLELGTIPLLLVAGLVEGFISPSAVAVPLKFGLGAALFTLLVLWILQGRRYLTADSSV
jgi:uncharacterized membrane protein SpoIIM required for sporulation